MIGNGWRPVPSRGDLSILNNKRIIKKMVRSEVKHYLWGTLCDSFVLADEPGLSIKEEIMSPGTKEQVHYHNVAQQFFYILEGEENFMVNEESFTLEKNQGIHIQSGERHYIANDQKLELSFLVISSPSTNEDRIFVEK